MNAFIKPPKKIAFFLKLGIAISKRVTGKDLLVPKLLAWYPKVAISSGILEALVNFTEREIVILASTVAQVNYWARLIQGLGAPPEGFSDKCKL